jgi:hypothetical protein
MWSALSDEKSGLYFSVFAGHRQRSLSQIWVPRDSEHNLLSIFLRLPQPGGPGSCIYFPQEQGSPVIPPGIGLLNQSLWNLLFISRHLSPSPINLRAFLCMYPLKVARQRRSKVVTMATNTHTLRRCMSLSVCSPCRIKQSTVVVTRKSVLRFWRICTSRAPVNMKPNVCTCMCERDCR